MRARVAADAAAIFDAARLTVARQLAGLRKSELAALLDKSPATVTAWESGAARPTAASVAQLALSLSVDPGFFAARPENIASLSTTPHFRSLCPTTQQVRDQAFAYGQVAVDIAYSLERHVDFPTTDVPSFPVSPEDQDGDGPEQAAQLIRAKWEIESGPVGHLVRLLENHGVLVVFSAPQAASIGAYSFDSVLRPVVVLNPTKHDYYCQRFDVAHELGHLVMHSDTEPGADVAEDQAHRFAAELLMPHDHLSDMLPTTVDDDIWLRLIQLKEHWGASIAALLHRAHQLGKLSDTSYHNAVQTMTARNHGEPGWMAAIEQPTMLSAAVELLAEQGVDEWSLIGQCRVPEQLFRTVTAQIPATELH